MWRTVLNRRARRDGVAVGIRRAEVGGEARQPRLAEALVDDVEQRPHRPLGQPRVGVRVDARRRRRPRR